MSITNIALLMIDGAHEGHIPAALHDILGEPILYHQIMQLKKLGVERFIISVNQIDIKALTLAEKLKHIGIQIEFITSLTALGDILHIDDKFIMVSEAVLMDNEHIRDVLQCNDPIILIIDNNETNIKFELIDLHHRWAGVAKLDGSLISLLKDLPEDSALQSALLRLALQSNYLQKKIDINASSLIKVETKDHADMVTDIKISNIHNSDKGLWQNYFFPLISKKILSMMFHNRDKGALIAQLIYFAPIIMAIFAIGFALLNFVIASFGFAFLGCFAQYVDQKRNSLESGDVDNSLMSYCTYFLLLMALIFTSMPIMNYLYIYASLMLFSLALIAQNVTNFRPYYLILSMADMFFLLMIAAIFKLQIYAIILISIIYLFWIAHITLSKR